MLIPQAGEKIDDFEIIRRIGAGGMGAVYLARQISTGRHVALKIFSAAMTREKTRHRFLREAQSASRLDHPHIVAVYHIHSDENLCYYAMEYVDGWPLSRIMHRLPGLKADPRKSLLDVLKQTGPELHPVDPDAETIIESPGEDPQAAQSTAPQAKMEKPREPAPLMQNRRYLREVVSMIRDIARALDYAHNKGVIHRDIKPDNLLLEHTGRLCLTDFGLARLIDEESITLTGELMGTPLYMSPEQVAAGRIGMDHRTDIYSLGVVLYQMLCLKPPYEANSREALLRAITLQAPTPLSSQNPAVPRNLETIVHCTLAKDPAQRYTTAGRLADDLDRWMAGKQIHAPHSGPLSQWWRHRSSAAKKTMVATAAGLAVVLGLSVWYLNQPQGSGPIPAKNVEKLTPIEHARQAALDNDYLRSALWHARDLAGDYQPGESKTLHCNIVFHQLPRLATRFRMQGGNAEYAFHPQKSLLVANSMPDAFSLYDLNNNETAGLATARKQKVIWTGYNRPGTFLAAITRGSKGHYLHLYDDNGQAQSARSAGPFAEIREIRLANTSPVAAVLTRETHSTSPITQPGQKQEKIYQAIAIDFSGDQPKKLRTFQTGKGVELSADGKFLAVVSEDDILQVFNLHNGGVMNLPFVGEPAGFIFSPRPDRPILAVTDRIGQITLFDVSRGQVLPDGSRMPEQLLILRTEPGRQRVAPVYMRFNADATRLLVVGAETLGGQVSGRSIRLWNTADGQKVFEARGRDAIFSRDGQTLVFWDRNQATFVDVENNNVLNQITTPIRTGAPSPEQSIRSYPPGVDQPPVSVDAQARRAVIVEPVPPSKNQDQRYLASVWDIDTGERIYRLLTSWRGLQQAGLSPQGEYAFGCYPNGEDELYMYVWDLREPDAPMPRAAELPYAPRTPMDLQVADRPFVAIYNQQNNGYAWAMVNPISLDLLNPLFLAPEPAEAWSVSRDGSTLVEIGWDDRLRAIDLQTANVLQNWPLPGTATRVLALSADGQRAAISHADFRISLHDIKAINGDSVYDEIGLLSGQPTHMSFNRQGTRLAIADALGRVVVNKTSPPFDYICEADTGRAISELAFCGPDDSCLVIAHTNGSVDLWSLPDGQLIDSIEPIAGDTGPASACVSISDPKAETTHRLLAVASSRKIRLFRLPVTDKGTLEPVGPPLETSQPIRTISFSRSGKEGGRLTRPLFAVTRKNAVRWYRLNNLAWATDQWRNHIFYRTGMQINQAGKPVILPQKRWQSARRAAME